MATDITVECGGGSTPTTLRYLGQDWPVVTPDRAELHVQSWRSRVSARPRDFAVQLYEVSDAVGVPPGGAAALLGGVSGQPVCAEVGGRVWFAELRRLEFIGWTSEIRISWIPTPAQIAKQESLPQADDGGWYFERMAPRWAESVKNFLAESAGNIAGELANFVGEVFGKAALAFLQTVGPWALVLLAGWLAVKVIA